ncbi:MAG: hypothetical protein JRJ26_05775 [Deltaproteobacteria bacterium]|nr:hypothetical protein [Deltaproteobacteria bacterium]
MRDILAIDVGTTAFKLGVFGPDLDKKCETSRLYEVNLYNQGKADIEPEKWWRALQECCRELGSALSSVGVVSLSVTTPGLVPMAEDGKALGPAILFFDGRSHRQAREIRQMVGEEKFLEETCNLPVSGGSSLCSILWIRDNQPRVWRDTAMFGHCNTYMVKRFTGQWAIDPSTTSITGLYNTARHDLTWNRDVLDLSGIPEEKLPPLMQSYGRAGGILPDVARELGLPESCDVLCGGNDAALGALSGGDDGTRRDQQHLRDLRDNQCLHRQAGQVEEFQCPLPRDSQPVGHLLRTKHGRQGPGVVPFGLLPRHEPGPVLRGLCALCPGRFFRQPGPGSPGGRTAGVRALPAGVPLQRGTAHRGLFGSHPRDDPGEDAAFPDQGECPLPRRSPERGGPPGETRQGGGDDRRCGEDQGPCGSQEEVDRRLRVPASGSILASGGCHAGPFLPDWRVRLNAFPLRC